MTNIQTLLGRMMTFAGGMILLNSCSAPHLGYAQAVNYALPDIVAYYPPEGTSDRLEDNVTGWVSKGPGSIHAVRSASWWPWSKHKIAKGSAEANAPSLFREDGDIYVGKVFNRRNVEPLPTVTITLTEASSSNLQGTANLSQVVDAWKKLGGAVTTKSSGSIVVTFINPRYFAYPGQSGGSLKELIKDKSRVNQTSRHGLRKQSMQVVQRALVADGFTFTYQRSSAGSAAAGGASSANAGATPATAAAPPAAAGAVPATASNSSGPGGGTAATPSAGVNTPPAAVADATQQRRNTEQMLDSLRTQFDDRGVTIKHADDTTLVTRSDTPIFIGFEKVDIEKFTRKQISVD